MSKKSTIQGAALGVLMLICAGLWYRNASSTGASDHEVKSGAAYQPMNVDNPQIHWDLLTDLQQTQYETTGRDIFNWHLPAPPPPPPVHIPGPGDADFQPPPPPPPPPPPQMPLKFYGVSTDSKGSARRAFLTDGSDVYIVAEGDSVLGRYRIRRITNANLEFEEIGSGRRASKPLEEQNPSK
jgi:hypothetical protein